MLCLSPTCNRCLSQHHLSYLYFSQLSSYTYSDLCPCSLQPLSYATNFCNFSLHSVSFYVSSVQSLCHVQLFATPRTAAHQASLSITNSQSLLKLMTVESVRPSNHLILCCPLLLLPSIFPSIRVFSKESVLCTTLLEFHLQHQSFP